MAEETKEPTIDWSKGRHSINVEYVKTISREEFINQFSHLDPILAGAEYDKIVPPPAKKPKE